jgi:hypothetical protein
LPARAAYYRLEARLVERFGRLHHLGPEPDRIVTKPWIRQTGPEVRRLEGVTIARRGVDEDGDFRPGRTERKGSLVGPGQAERPEDGRDLGPGLDDSDRLQETRAERAFERVRTPNLLEQFAPGRAAAPGAGRWSVGFAGRGAGGPLAQATALVAVPAVVADLRHTVVSKNSNGC